MCSIKNKAAKALTALAFCLPSIIPVNLLIMTIPSEILVNPSFLLRLTVSVIDGLRLSGLIIIASIFIDGDGLKESIKCSLLFSAIRLMSIFTADNTLLTGIYNPLTYEVLDTLSTYTYRNGLINGDGSFAAAMHIAKSIAQILPAAAGTVIAAFVFSSKQKPAIRTNAYPAIAVAIIPIAMLVITVMNNVSSDGVAFMDEFVNGYINGIIIAVFSALLTAVIAAVMANLASESGIYGLSVVALLIATANSIMGNYLIIRSINLANTPIGVILQNLSLVPIMLLVFAYPIKSGKNIIPVALAGAGVCFAWFWGDTMAPMILLNNRELFPISLMFREVSLSASINVSALWYIAIPLAVSGICMIFSSVLSKE